MAEKECATAKAAGAKRATGTKAAAMDAAEMGRAMGRSTSVGGDGVGAECASGVEDYAEDGRVYTEEVEALPQSNGGGIHVPGIYGENTTAGMADRSVRSATFMSHNDYRLVTPCFQCRSCIEFRKFDHRGEAESIGYYCILGDFRVDRYGTCRYGGMMKNGRRRVVYDLANAPAGFSSGLCDVTQKRYYKRSEQRRADQQRKEPQPWELPDASAYGVSGMVPRGLAN